MRSRIALRSDQDLLQLQACLANWRRDAGSCGYCHPGELFQRVHAELGAVFLLAERVHVWQDDRGVRPLTEAFPVPTLPLGFTLRVAHLADAAQLATVRRSAFGTNWTGDAYCDRVMCKPGYDPARELVVCAPDGRLAALCVIWLDELKLGWTLRAGRDAPRVSAPRVGQGAHAWRVARDEARGDDVRHSRA